MNDDKTSLINIEESGFRDERHTSCIVIEGDRIGKIFHFAKTINLIGRSEDADIRLDSTTVSRRHAEIRVDSGSKLFIRDLNSSNGTYVNGQRIQEVELHEGDIFTIGTYKLKIASLSRQDTLFFRRIVDNAERDALTGLYNKGSIMQILRFMFEQSTRSKKPLSLAMIDIDHFKRINDAYGHVAGDAILRHVAGLLASHLRSADKPGRFGGEEFLLLFDNTSLDDARNACERIRKTISETPAAYEDQTISVTVSIGIASSETHSIDDPDAFIKQADKKLYAAKKKGRNRVVS